MKLDNLCPTCGCLPDQTHTDPACSTSDDLAVAGAFENRSLYRAKAAGDAATDAETLARDIWRSAPSDWREMVAPIAASLASKDAEIAGLRRALKLLCQFVVDEADLEDDGRITDSADHARDVLAAIDTALAAGKEQGDGDA